MTSRPSWKYRQLMQKRRTLGRICRCGAPARDMIVYGPGTIATCGDPHCRRELMYWALSARARIERGAVDVT